MKISQIKKVALAITLVGAFGNIKADGLIKKLSKKRQGILDKNLFNALAENYPRKVQKAIKAGANVNSTTEIEKKEGYTPLMLAIEKQNKEIVKMLIEAKANLNAKTWFKNTPLYIAISPTLFEYAAKHQNKGLRYEIVKMLIEAGADVNAINEYGNTALMRAVEKKNNKIGVELIEAGADVNAINSSDNTILMQAVAKKNIHIMPFLLKAGTDVHATNRLGETALDIAESLERREGRTPTIRDMQEMLKKYGTQ